MSIEDVLTIASKLSLALEARDSADRLVTNLRQQLVAALDGHPGRSEAVEEAEFLGVTERLRLLTGGKDNE